MSLVAHGLLELLEGRPKHGYELRRSFDERFAGGRPLRSGQVYSTLGRLERDGRVDDVGGEQGPGPERRDRTRRVPSGHDHDRVSITAWRDARERS